MTLRRWFLKKRPVCPTSMASVGPWHRLSLLKPRHTPSSHTQALRPIVSQTASEASPVPCLKELAHSITAFGIEDYSLGIRCRLLKLNELNFFETRIKFADRFSASAKVQSKDQPSVPIGVNESVKCKHYQRPLWSDFKPLVQHRL